MRWDVMHLKLILMTWIMNVFFFPQQEQNALLGLAVLLVPLIVLTHLKISQW